MRASGRAAELDRAEPPSSEVATVRGRQDPQVSMLRLSTWRRPCPWTTRCASSSALLMPHWPSCRRGSTSCTPLMALGDRPSRPIDPYVLPGHGMVEAGDAGQHQGPRILHQAEVAETRSWSTTPNV